jgi:PadR family transcriptional regulator PadR
MKEPAFEIQNLTKNCNEALILAVLWSEKKHGYQMALEIEDASRRFFKFNHGTLYPILHKLEHEGLIKGSWTQEGPKRKRKMYSLTAKGRQYVSSQLAAWREFFSHFFDIVGGIES